MLPDIVAFADSFILSFCFMSRAIKFFLARVADQLERYSDVVAIMRELIAENPKLSSEERNLFSICYKSLTTKRRSGIRTVNAYMDDEANQRVPEFMARLTEFKERLSGELDALCNEVISTVDQKLMPTASDSISRVFYLKLKADYYRYLVEFKGNQEKQEGAAKAKRAYDAAMKIATESFPKAHPTYLGLALNYSVFLYEIADEKDTAVELADKTFKDAVELVDDLIEEDYSEATLILQLLKDNTAMWSESAE